MRLTINHFLKFKFLCKTNWYYHALCIIMYSFSCDNNCDTICRYKMATTRKETINMSIAKIQGSENIDIGEAYYSNKSSS